GRRLAGGRRQAVHRREAVQGPGQPAGPGAGRVPALVRALAQEVTRLVEQALVGGAAVGPDDVFDRGEAVVEGYLTQGVVAGGVGGVEDQSDVHHDVDEQRLRPDERGQVATRPAAQGERAAGLDQYVEAVAVAGQVVLAQVGREEEEAEV